MASKVKKHCSENELRKARDKVVDAELEDVNGVGLSVMYWASASNWSPLASKEIIRDSQRCLMILMEKENRDTEKRLKELLKDVPYFTKVAGKARFAAITSWEMEAKRK